MLRKVITWAIVIFIVYYLVSNPHGASDAVQSALRGLRSAGNSLSTFVNQPLAMRQASSTGPAAVSKYLLPREVQVATVRQHPAVLLAAGSQALAGCSWPAC